MAEIPFVFGSKDAYTTQMFVGTLVTGGWTEKHQQMSDVMQGYWASMFSAGDPNADATAELPTWPKYSRAHDEWMELTVPPRAKPLGLYSDNCDFWDSVGLGDADDGAISGQEFVV